MTFLLLLIVFGLIGYFIGKSGTQPQHKVDEQLAQQNRDWYLYIKSFKKLFKDKTQKKLIDDILIDVKKQGLVGADFDGNEQEVHYGAEAWADTNAQQEYVDKSLIPGTEAKPPSQPGMAASIPSKPKTEIQLDNASLLLYLGAFIFVASVGLFVAFGSFGGYLKTLVVLILAIVVYAAGIVLFGRKKFMQVGIAFAAIGMAIVPFVGLAAYLYIFEQSNGAAVWFVTSILCLAVYAHALTYFRKPFLNYIFIFTLLSLFESSVSVINVPIYYFGWAMAFLGILLGFVATIKNVWPDFKESAYASGQLLIPLSIVVSAGLVPNEGSLQMGISLLLATAFYGLQALNSKDQLRENYLVVTQVLGAGAVLWLAYGFTSSFRATAIAALILNAIQLVALLVGPRISAIWYNFGTILVATTILGIVLAVQDSTLLLSAVLMLLAVGAVVWLRQDRLEGYVLAVSSLMVAPVIIGQLVIDNGVSTQVQSVMLLIALVVQWAVYLLYRASTKADLWRQAAQPMFVVSLVLVAFASTFASPLTCLVVCAIAALLTLALAHFDDDGNWASVAGAVITVPVARSFVGSHEPLLCVAIALAFNIGLALKYRQEFNRWLGSGLWFIVPIAIGSSNLGGEWTEALYAYAFMLVAVGFVAARAIARGVWLVSSKVPMASYAKSASFSYVVGYGLALVTSIALSLISSDSHVLTTTLLGITTVLTLLVAMYIEKEPTLYGAIPILAQAMLVSALRPTIDDTQMVTTFVLSSSVLAASFYFVVRRFFPEYLNKSLGVVSLLLLFVAPISVLYFESVWAMPVTLMLASTVLYYHYKDVSQTAREAMGGLFTVGILWLLWQLGVREIQAFSHVVVALLAGYAVWRAKRGEKAISDQYVLAMLATATVPLIMQALSGEAGGLYGWWLLLEQIGFIAVGMFVGSKLMIQWGLYVAVAAVLYQLRGLGWAALAFLGIFVIGLAIYQIHRINKN